MTFRASKIFKILPAFLVMFVASTSLTSCGNPKQQDNQHTYTGSKAFFNSVYDSIKIDNSKSINKYYDTLPKIKDPNNFCSLGTVKYKNILDKTVTVDPLYRFRNDSKDDPNFAQCMLVYQAIQYKVKHPDKKVDIALTTYRFSVAAAACLRRDSKYFGYMRNLFYGEYDDFGFVKLSFLLVEAAKMGINVIFTPQLNSYGVRQYDPNISKDLVVIEEPLYREYFPKYLTTECYKSYCPTGKKVKDYFVYAPNEWRADNYRTDMLHVKNCLVSAYTDMNNVDHKYGSYFSSANYDSVDYLGRNGNNGSQSGYIITNHEPIYRCTRNFIKLLSEHNYEDGACVFRSIVRDRTENQMQLYLKNKASEINKDEQILYLNNEKDDTFELYFTPLGGGLDAWNETYNPFCKYFAKVRNSAGPITMAWTSTYADYDSNLDSTFDATIAKTFLDKASVHNRLFLHVKTYGKLPEYNQLVEDKNIGYKYVNDEDLYLHSKDMYLTYYVGNEKQYTSILTSANIGQSELYYRPNSFVVIKENFRSHQFYDILAKATYHANFFENNKK